MRISDWSSDVCSSDLAFHHEALADGRLGHVEAVDVELMVVLCIGDRRLQRLLHVDGDAPLREGQLGEGRLGRLAADRLRHRSEEHTSELQSLMRSSYAVFCLKKKQIEHKHHTK